MNRLNKFLVFLIFLINSKTTLFCKKEDLIKEFYHNIHLDSLPWGISPIELKKQQRDYFIQESNQYIEFGIKTEVKNQKQTPILNELDPPLMFRLVCDYSNNQCVIFRIEKIGTQNDIEIYYNNFIKNNHILESDLKKETFNEYKTEAGNLIKENYKLFELKNYIIEVYLTHMFFPEDLKQSHQFIEQTSDIDIRIYSKRFNPNINLDFFIKN